MLFKLKTLQNRHLCNAKRFFTSIKAVSALDRHLKVFFIWQVPLLLLAQCLPSVVFVGHSQQTPSLPPDVHVFTVPLEISGPGTVLVACLRESQCLEELTRDQVLFWLSHSGVCVLRCSTNKVLTFESTLQLSYYQEFSFHLQSAPLFLHLG